MIPIEDNPHCLKIINKYRNDLPKEKKKHWQSYVLYFEYTP